MDLEPGLAECVARTQQLLASTTTRVRITPQLLARPPVKFIRDVFVDVSVSTGCGQGLFTVEEIRQMASSRENKFVFLTVLLHFVATAVNEPHLLNRVKVAKMAAGLEPENTNLLLQRLHLAATSDACRSLWDHALDQARGAREGGRATAVDCMPALELPASPEEPAYTTPSPSPTTAYAALQGSAAPTTGARARPQGSAVEQDRPHRTSERCCSSGNSNSDIVKAQLATWYKSQPTPAEEESWRVLLLAEGFTGLEDGRLARLADHAAGLQKAAERLREVAREDGHLAAVSEAALGRLLLGYIWPSALGPPEPTLGEAKPEPEAENSPESSEQGSREGMLEHERSKPQHFPPLRVEHEQAKRESIVMSKREFVRDHMKQSITKSVGDPGAKKRDSRRAETMPELRERHSAEVASRDAQELLRIMRDKRGVELIDEVDKILRRKTVDLNVPLSMDFVATPLLYAVACAKNPGLVKLLIDFRANVRATYHGMEAWCDLLPGQTALEFAATKRKDPKGKAHDRWEAMEDILKAEVDRLRGWQKGRRNTHSLTWNKDRLHELSARFDREDHSETESEGGEAMSRAASINFNKKSRPTIKRSSTGEATELMRSLYQAKAGFLCEHIECHPSEMYDIEDKVGEGSFSSVRRGLNKQTGIAHAIKMLPKMLLEDLSLWSEIAIMRQLDHPHIMKLFSTFEDQHNVYMVCELCTGGQLFDAIITAGTICEHTSARMMKQMLAAVSYLHLHFICHRDLKPENFMLAYTVPLNDAHIKLIDFGTAKRFDLETMTTKVCTVHYVAPDILKNQPVAYTEKCDVWSCGVILYVMLCGSPPFGGETDMEVLQKVKRGKFSFQPAAVWEHISEDGHRMVKNMLTVKVQNRYSAEQAAHDDWVMKLAPNAENGNLAKSKVLRKMRAFHAYNKLKKVALQVIAQQLPDESLDQLRQTFLAIDTDMKGALTAAQMEEAIARVPCDEDSRLEMMETVYSMADSTGEINYTQFLASNIDRQLYLREEACKAAFALLDVDGDGFISREDLALLFANTGGEEDLQHCEEALESPQKDGNLASSAMKIMGVNIEEIEKIISDTDTDGDGSISFHEFMLMMKSRGHTVITQASALTEDVCHGRRQSLGKSVKRTRPHASVLRDDALDQLKPETPVPPSSSSTSSVRPRVQAQIQRSPTQMLMCSKRVREAGRHSRAASVASSVEHPDRPESRVSDIGGMCSEMFEVPRQRRMPCVELQQARHRSVIATEPCTEPGSVGAENSTLEAAGARHRPGHKMVKSTTVIFGSRSKHRPATSRSSSRAGEGPASAGNAHDGEGGAADWTLRPSFCPCRTPSVSIVDADLPGPNPLWEILRESSINMEKLQACLESGGSRYVNSYLHKEECVPPALFVAVSLRSPEMVRLLITYQADVRRKFQGPSTWKVVKCGQTPRDVNEVQKGRFVGTVLYERCDAIETLLRAEEDRLRGWRSGRRASSAAQHYFDTVASQGADQSTSRISLHEADEEIDRLLRAPHQDTCRRTPEAVLSSKTLYSSEATWVCQHITERPSEFYDIKELLGEGTFGAVSVAVDRNSGINRAMKTVPKYLVEESDLWMEIELMRDIDHPYITRLFETYEDTDSVHIIMEYCGGGELFDAIERAGNLGEDTCAVIFRQMLVSCSYLHAKRICHRDLKPENFLLSKAGPVEDTIVKLIDFGTARRFGPSSPMATKICTIHYVAPEMLSRSAEAYTEKCDSWSLGVCMYVMLCGSPPFCGDSDTQVLKKVRRGKYKFEPEDIWNVVSQDARHLVSSLLVIDVDERLSPQQALGHAWFNKVARRPVSRETMKDVFLRLIEFRNQFWFKQKSMELVANQLSEHDVDDLRSIWLEIHRSNTGKLRHTDIAEAIPADDEDQRFTEARAELLRVAEEDGLAREMTYTSFLAAMLDEERYLNEAACKSAFNLLDLDGNGCIGIPELSIIIQSDQMDSTCSGDWQLSDIVKVVTNSDPKVLETCKQIVRKYDINHDDAINFQEFMCMMRGEIVWSA